MVKIVWAVIYALAALLLVAVFVERWGAWYVFGFIGLAVLFRAVTEWRQPPQNRPPTP